MPLVSIYRPAPIKYGWRGLDAVSDNPLIDKIEYLQEDRPYLSAALMVGPGRLLVRRLGALTPEQSCLVTASVGFSCLRLPAILTFQIVDIYNPPERRTSIVPCLAGQTEVWQDVHVASSSVGSVPLRQAVPLADVHRQAALAIDASLKQPNLVSTCPAAQNTF